MWAPGAEPVERPPAPAEQEHEAPGEPVAGAPAPRRADEDAPVAVGPNGLVLARRRPQTHLAPELIRRTPGIPAATPATAAHAAPPLAGPGIPAAGRPAGPPGGRSAMDALSAYQASRAAARSAISDDAGDAGDALHDEAPSATDHPQRGSTPGRQT